MEEEEKNSLYESAPTPDNNNIINFVINDSKKEYIKNEINKLKIKMNKIISNINDMINILKKSINNLEIYFKEKNNIINTNNIKNDINGNYYEEIEEYIDNIINDNNFINKFKNILKLYNRMNNKIIRISVNNANEKQKELNEIILRYKIGNEKPIKILGHIFVENNKDKCNIIYKGEKYALQEIFDKYDESDQLLEIKLDGINEIKDMSYIFQGCTALLSFSDLSNWNTVNVNNMNSLFYKCSSLKYLPDISTFNTSNVNNMSNMFLDCSSLTLLPDISKWNTAQVNNMSNMFLGCSSLISFPDISKWDTSQVNNMSNLFSGCLSLNALMK